MIKNTLDDFIIEKMMTGSRIICNPPVMTTDEDWFVLTTSRSNTTSLLVDDGWKLDSEFLYADSYFTSMRKGDINYILIEDRKFYEACCVATKMATQLNIKDKNDRVKFFTIVKRAYGFVVW